MPGDILERFLHIDLDKVVLSRNVKTTKKGAEALLIKYEGWEEMPLLDFVDFKLLENNIYFHVEPKHKQVQQLYYLNNIAQSENYEPEAMFKKKQKAVKKNTKSLMAERKRKLEALKLKPDADEQALIAFVNAAKVFSENAEKYTDPNVRIGTNDFLNLLENSKKFNENLNEVPGKIKNDFLFSLPDLRKEKAAAVFGHLTAVIIYDLLNNIAERESHLKDDSLKIATKVLIEQDVAKKTKKVADTALLKRLDFKESTANKLVDLSDKFSDFILSIDDVISADQIIANLTRLKAESENPKIFPFLLPKTIFVWKTRENGERELLEGQHAAKAIFKHLKERDVPLTKLVDTLNLILNKDNFNIPKGLDLGVNGRELILIQLKNNLSLKKEDSTTLKQLDTLAAKLQTLETFLKKFTPNPREMFFNKECLKKIKDIQSAIVKRKIVVQKEPASAPAQRAKHEQPQFQRLIKTQGKFKDTTHKPTAAPKRH